MIPNMKLQNYSSIADGLQSGHSYAKYASIYPIRPVLGKIVHHLDWIISSGGRVQDLSNFWRNLFSFQSSKPEGKVFFPYNIANGCWWRVSFSTGLN